MYANLIGIVGTGGIANTHAAGLAALADDAELVACCDIAPDRVADFAERWGFGTSTTLPERCSTRVRSTSCACARRIPSTPSR